MAATTTTTASSASNLGVDVEDQDCANHAAHHVIGRLVLAVALLEEVSDAALSGGSTRLALFSFGSIWGGGGCGRSSRSWSSSSGRRAAFLLVLVVFLLRHYFSGLVERELLVVEAAVVL